MTNTALFQTMIQKYSKLSFSHDYIFGFKFDGNIYMTIVKASVLPYVLKLDRASRGAGMSLRFKPTKEQTKAKFLRSLSLNILVRNGKKTAFLFIRMAISQ